MDRRSYIASALLMVISASCGHHSTGIADDSGLVAKVGNKSLTRAELSAAIPLGLSAEDSVNFVKAYVRQWIDSRLVSELSPLGDNDMERIDKMVSEYRNQLIMWEYCRQMYLQDSAGTLNEDSLKAYYERHSDEYRLETPLVKGIFVRLQEKSPRLADIRKWIVSKNNEDLDKLEQQSMEGNVEYEYFRDDWRQWATVARKMPVKPSLASIPASGTRRFEAADDGEIYMLAISGYLPAGSAMPYEIAREAVVEQFRNASRPEYERTLRRQLLDNGIADGKVTINIDINQETVKNNIK